MNVAGITKRPATWAGLDVRRAVRRAMIVVVAGGLTILSAYWMWLFYEWWRVGLPGTDWSNLSGLDPFHPYTPPTAFFRWSVPAAFAWAWLVQPMGLLLWRLLHIAAALTIPDRRVALLTLVSFPFWGDLLNGSTLTFAFVAAWWALSGNRYGVWAFCILAALMPRPIMLPVLVWLLWHRTDARWAFLGATVVVIVTGLLSGTLIQWITLLGGISGGEITADYNVGPSHWVGPAWMLVGVPLAIWATARGRLGIASIAIAPYVIHYYAIMGLLELHLCHPDEARDMNARATRPGVDRTRR